MRNLSAASIQVYHIKKEMEAKERNGTIIQLSSAVIRNIF